MEDSSLSFSPIATTLAYCGEDSMDTQFLSYLENVATYVLSGGKLYLNLWADAGNMVFSSS
jgi:heat shock protein HslJ